MEIRNARTDCVVASIVEVATTRTERRRGLLGRDSLDIAAAMVLSPCCSIHTAFMRFPIDVAFVDRDGQVTRIVRDLAPWRVAIAPRAHAAVEFAGGCLSSRDLRVGDRLLLMPSPAGAGAEEPLSTSWSVRSVSAA